MFRLFWIIAGLSIASFAIGGCGGGVTAWETHQGATETRAATQRGSATDTATSPATLATGLNMLPSRTPRPTNTPQPTFTTSPTPLGCWQSGGNIETGNLDTGLLPLPLDYRIYLPPCYQQQPERRYAVLYLIHGQGSNDDQWDRLGADELADGLIGAGEIPPFMIVMPRDRYGGQPSENNFAIALAEELIPHIDENYRTLRDPGQRAIGGLSRGGGWAVHLAITRWDIFGALGGHSPAIFYDDAQRMRVYLNEIPSDAMPRIYIDIGDRDRPEIMRAALWFEELLDERGIPHEWYLFSGYHNADYWRDHLETYLRWYSQNW